MPNSFSPDAPSRHRSEFVSSEKILDLVWERHDQGLTTTSTQAGEHFEMSSRLLWDCLERLKGMGYLQKKISAKNNDSALFWPSDIAIADNIRSIAASGKHPSHAFKGCTIYRIPDGAKLPDPRGELPKDWKVV